MSVELPDTNSPSTSNTVDLPVSAGGVISFASRVVCKIAADMGYKKFSDSVPRLPEIIGEAIAKKLNTLRKNAPNGAEPTPEEEACVIQEVILEHPDIAPTLLGFLLSSTLEDGLDADTERKAVLTAYGSVLNLIGTVATELNTSLALRGFVHRSNCISYWHRTYGSSAWRQHDNSLRPDGIEVYLLEVNPSDENLETLNEEIRNSSQRQLPKNLFNHYENADISKVNAVYELKVDFVQLNPEASSSVFGIGPHPVQYTSRIPNGAPAISDMFASLILALSKQSEHRVELAKTLAKADSLRMEIIQKAGIKNE